MGVGENSQGVGLMQQKDHTLVFWSNGGKVYLAVIISWYCWHGVIGHIKWLGNHCSSGLALP